MGGSLKKRSKPNYWYTISSVTLVLIILGSVGLIVLRTKRIVERLKESVVIIVEINNDTKSADLRQLRGYLKASDFIIQESLRYVSKEEGAAFLIEDFGEDFLSLGLPNPLLDVFTFNVYSQYMKEDSLSKIKTDIEQFSIVSDVYYQQAVLEIISDNINRIIWILLGIGLFSLFIAGILIHNTVKLALYSNRFQIKNMQLVGAKSSFIRRPYLRKSIWNGVISAVLAITAIVIFAFWLEESMPELGLFEEAQYLVVLSAIIIFLGIVINAISTYFTVNKYLKTSLDELY